MTIVIPQRNHSHLTMTCVSSIRQFHGDSFPILIIDDGSERESILKLSPLRSVKTRVVCRPPLGVTSSWDSGLKRVQTPYIVFLNNDTITEGAWVGELVEPLRSGVALISGVAMRRENWLPRNLPLRILSERFLEGWCFAIRKETLRSVGGFDRWLVLYFSDTDIQLRLLLAAHGCQSPLCVVKELPIRHIGHATTRNDPSRADQWRRDQKRFLAKWGSEKE